MRYLVHVRTDDLLRVEAGTPSEARGLAVAWLLDPESTMAVTSVTHGELVDEITAVPPGRPS